MFLENRGPDSSYQAIAALNLQVWLIYFPDKKLEARPTGRSAGSWAASGPTAGSTWPAIPAPASARNNGWATKKG